MGLGFTTRTVLFMIVQGCGAAASTRVSNELGGWGGGGECGGLLFLVGGRGSGLVGEWWVVTEWLLGLAPDRDRHMDRASCQS